MNKTDDILEKLKNANQPEIDMTEEIMNNPLLTSPKGKSLTPRPLQGERVLNGKKLWPWMCAIAASIVLLLVFRFTQKPIEGETISHQQLYARLYPSQQEREWHMASTPSFEETVAEIEQSGKQLQLAIAEMQK